MISESRAREIDYYFDHDHRARLRSFVIATGIGTVVLMLCRVADLSEPFSFFLLCLSVAAAFGLFLASYHPQRYLDRMRAQGQRSLAGFQGHDSYFFGRRLALLGIPASIIAAIGLAFAPKFTEAEVINRRLRRLLLASHDSEARAMAQDAVNIGVPLRPDVLKAIGTQARIGSSGNLETFDGLIGSANRSQNRAIVELSGGEKIIIWPRLVYMPAGEYRVTGAINAFSVSLVGDGPTKSSILVGFEGATTVRALLNYSSGMLADAIVYGITATAGSMLPESAESFLSVGTGSSKVAVLNVAVQFLHQSLDRIIWEDVSFDRCRITCGGDWFRITNVEFTDCHFDFAEGVPAIVRARFENLPNQKISMQFHP